LRKGKKPTNEHETRKGSGAAKGPPEKKEPTKQLPGMEGFC